LPPVLGFRNFRKAEADKIIGYLSVLDWNSLLADPSVETWLLIKNILTYCIESFVPYVNISGSNEVVKWTAETRSLARKQKIAHRLYKRDPTDFNKMKWKSAFCAARRAKRADVLSHDEKLLQSPTEQKYWKLVRSRLSPKSDIPHLIQNGNVISLPAEKAGTFNAFFSGVYQQDNSIPVPPGILAADSLFSNCDFGQAVVLEHLKMLEPNFSCGPDNIPQWFLHRFAVQLALPLSILFQKSF
jgi:hypothetical protein